MKTDTKTILNHIHFGKFTPENELIQNLIVQASLGPTQQRKITEIATDFVHQVQADLRPNLMEIFLSEYGLSTKEGIALMCLAEALLRVPDDKTMDDLIEDKIAPSDWGKHRGRSASSMVNGSTWALMFAGRVLNNSGERLSGHLRATINRLGKPVIRAAVRQALKRLGRQFVLSENIESAIARGGKSETHDYTHSFDMLGEAAMTAEDAHNYEKAYSDAITAIALHSNRADIHSNPGISVKLSALHPRYEMAQKVRVITELVPVVLRLACQAARANMSFNIDAEEADRLVLSLEVIEAVLSDKQLAAWDGFGVAVQAYDRRANLVLDWLHALTKKLNRRINIRLVKGAYWDTEIKQAQVNGLESFPVFTRKQATDISYIACVRKLSEMTDRIYPQFATHNAHTIAAILNIAENLPKDRYEFQRLHGMGERLHKIVKKRNQTRCRIYAPVGAHLNLLSYLVRRFLENGANSSFVNQIVDKDLPPEQLTACPFEAMTKFETPVNARIPNGFEIFDPDRRNSAGFDLTDVPTLDRIEAARNTFKAADVTSIISGALRPGTLMPSINPATGETIAMVTTATPKDVETALATVQPWDVPAAKRAQVLHLAAKLYELNFGTALALLASEAGKSIPDAVGELREAVDFLRYYANKTNQVTAQERGVFACISPWNYPLAIFTGQIAASLGAGNGVLAKPAEQTALIAGFAVQLLHQAGVPRECLQLLLGSGPVVGTAITSDSRVAGVAFTGSTETARTIRRNMIQGMSPDAPLIAETGGLNAMVVDSTALPEQAIRDIIASSFHSAGQRCSALRCLYLQEEIAENTLKMLQGAMNELTLGNPWQLSTDVGPIIDTEALDVIQAHIEDARANGLLIHQLPARDDDRFVAPALIRVSSIRDLKHEIFGPVLHVAIFKAGELNQVIADINATGYGLTFGLHTRLDARVQQISDELRVGNTYVNRNQVGAIVGSQPFGGEGLSGTGPKAGGPNYLARFCKNTISMEVGSWKANSDVTELQLAIDAAPGGRKISVTKMPGPTGESNHLSAISRSSLICMGPGKAAAQEQARLVRKMGGEAVIAPGMLAPENLTQLTGYSGVIWWGSMKLGHAYARALAELDGPLLSLVMGIPDLGHVAHERHLCIDTTASGGNIKLLSLNN
jgi:RHH-type proline utilization regulon transcriptional repressor/proline dehydrogenase/delta 1-pyrroline-5-carboxylate dehydrogenase